jgi:AraC family transcriptional regulator, regulatory protein of adaptative response / DNA-3-methyladenine glycosylase II
MGVSTLWIPTTEPFDGASLLAFFGARAVAGVEEVTEESYRRSVSLKNGPGAVCVRPAAAGVHVELDLDDAADEEEAAALVRRLFDLDADPAPIAAVLSADPLLAPLVARHPGIRLPGAVDGFEAAVRAIVGQQISVAGARTVLGRMVETYGGRTGPGPPAPAAGRLFPAPGALAEADPSGFPFPRARGAALVEVARLVASGEAMTPDRLLAIPGVGPWTVSYIAMRAFGDPDVFLAGDLGVRQALAALGAEPDPDRWRPWRSYATMLLWRSLGT